MLNETSISIHLIWIGFKVDIILIIFNSFLVEHVFLIFDVYGFGLFKGIAISINFKRILTG